MLIDERRAELDLRSERSTYDEATSLLLIQIQLVLRTDISLESLELKLRAVEGVGCTIRPDIYLTLLRRVAEDIRAIHTEREASDATSYTEVKVAEATLSQVGTLVVILAISLELLKTTEAIAHSRKGSDPCTDRDMMAHGEEDRSVIEVPQDTAITIPALSEVRSTQRHCQIHDEGHGVDSGIGGRVSGVDDEAVTQTRTDTPESSCRSRLAHAECPIAEAAIGRAV